MAKSNEYRDIVKSLIEDKEVVETAEICLSSERLPIRKLCKYLIMYIHKNDSKEAFKNMENIDMHSVAKDVMNLVKRRKV